MDEAYVGSYRISDPWCCVDHKYSWYAIFLLRMIKYEVMVCTSGGLLLLIWSPYNRGDHPTYLRSKLKEEQMKEHKILEYVIT